MFLKSSFSLAILVFVFSAVNISAAILTVTTNEDTNDGVCDAHCSLREAVGNAGYKDTIIFDRSLRETTINLTQTLQVSGSNITIDGPHERRITIRGNGTFRVLKISGVIFMDDLVIRDGAETQGEGMGGAINSGGTLFLTNCLITNSTALRGGGIFHFGGLLYLLGTTVSNNTSTADYSAGGIQTYHSNAWIINSTISGNRSLSNEGGMGGVLAGNDGGDGFMYIYGTTIAYNSSSGTGTAAIGGLATSGPGGTYLANSIVAKNSGVTPDLYGSTSSVNSLIGINPQTSVIENGINGNIAGSARNPIDPQLGLLADNGGSIPTHALLNTSPAIDAGNNSRATDRRGTALTIDERGYQRIANSTVDIGSFEYNSQPVEVLRTIIGQVRNANGRGISGARVTLRDANGELKTVLTNPFGFYSFTNLPFAAYTVEAKDKRYIFPSQTFLAEEATEFVIFTAK